MVKSSTTEPTKRGLENANSGSTTGFNIQLSYPMATTASCSAGDWMVINASGYAAKNATDEARAHGVAMNDSDNTLGSDGDKSVTLLVWGPAEVDCLVETLGGGAGYNADIDIGDKLYLGGYTSGTGQYVVAGDGTETVTANSIGTALDRQDGDAAAIVTSKLRIFVDTLSGRE